MAQLVGRDQLASLGIRERALVRLHLFRCRHCRAYVEQIQAIGQLFRDMGRDDPADDEAVGRLEKRVFRDLGVRGERSETANPSDPATSPDAPTG